MAVEMCPMVHFMVELGKNFPAVVQLVCTNYWKLCAQISAPGSLIWSLVRHHPTFMINIFVQCSSIKKRKFFPISIIFTTPNSAHKPETGSRGAKLQRRAARRQCG